MKFKITFLVLILVVAPALVEANFSDVSNSYQYRYGVDYLFDNDIVEGYEDGTFKPFNKINRAELTKIVVESVGLDLVSERGCFPDLDVTQWYAPYVCTAKQAGWVEGYEDGTFQPTRTINRAESVKVIAEAEEWDLPTSFSAPYSDTSLSQWYTKYVAFAKNKNFLPFSSRFSAGDEILRGEFSEVYYRVLYTRNEFLDEFINPHEDEEVAIEEPESDVIDVEDAVVDFGTDVYAADVFDSINLDDDFPKTFYENEVYKFEGEVAGSYDSMFIFMYPQSDPDNISTYSSELSSDRFEVDIYFDQEGTYILGMIPGLSGSSKVAVVAVSDLPSESNSVSAPEAPSIGSVSFDGEFTSASFDADSNLVRHTFTQGGDEVVYLSRQVNDDLTLRYADFEDFSVGTVNWNMAAANIGSGGDLISDWESSPNKSFNATQHYYSEVEDEVTVYNLPDYHSTGESITLRGETSTDLASEFYAILPNGLIYEDKDASSFDAGDSFSFDYTFATNGTHIIEVNDTRGLAVINHPVYQRGSIPLIPDYFDLNRLILEPGKSFNSSSEESTLLRYINQERSRYGFGGVTLESDLSAIAEDHAEDMKDRDYFAHVNLNGLSPNDRRVAAGIDSLVGENIAKSVSTKFAHEALMRSAVHRANILNPSWTEVGLGVVRNSDGYFYVVQEFSFDPNNLNKDFEESFNDERSGDLAVNEYLQTAADSWVNLMIEEDFFATENGDERVFDYLEDGHGLAEVKALILSGGTVSGMTELGFESSDIDQSKWTQAGFAAGVTDSGSIYLVVLYGR